MRVEQQVKERPILFSGPMVTAILEERKTQARRVMKPQPRVEKDGTDRGWRYWQPNNQVVYAFRIDEPIAFPLAIISASPYGRVGDRLWVRETWQPEGVTGHEREYPIVYRATNDNRVMGHRWRPSIHMPRWASRITLEITGVRVEPIQNISEIDAMREGCELPSESPRNYRRVFRALWDSINEARGYGWELNCWVWVLEFKKV